MSRLYGRSLFKHLVKVCLKNGASAVASLLQSGAMFHEPAAKAIAEMIESWALCGMQSIEPGQRLAASLAATNYPDGFVKELEHPWTTFCVIAPAGAVTASELLVFFTAKTKADGAPIGMILLYCESLTGIVPFAAGPDAQMGSDSIFVCRAFDTLDQVSGEHWPEKAPIREGRIFEVAKKLIVGCVVEMGGRQPSPSMSHGSGGPRLKRGEPVFNVFTLARAVTLDLRDAVREHIASGKAIGRNKLTVQTLVAGHYKMQPHGEGRAQRKYIHVEPYWRGPEDAPIVVRPHRLKGEVAE